MIRRVLALALACACVCALLPRAVRAAGFFFPDQGARAMGRGATGAGGTRDLSALFYNPAGLAELPGLYLQLDGSVASERLDFTRAGACGAQASCRNVSDSAGVFPNTVSGVSLDLGLAAPALRGLVVALGVYGPSSVGHHEFPDPAAAGGAQGTVEEFAPQRYSLISANNLILYPSLAVAYRLSPFLDVGASMQYRYFHVSQRQAIFGVAAIGGDISAFDAIVKVSATEWRPTFSGGLLAHGSGALAGVSLGLSGRLGTPVEADGTIDVQVPPAASALHIAVQGHDAHLSLRMPSEARLGARLERPWGLLALDGGWEGWGAVQDERVTPEGVSLVSGTGSNATVSPLAPIVLRKGFHGAFSLRGGGEYLVGPLLGSALTVRAGALWESSAIPDQTMQVDFVDGPRFAGTAGCTLRAGRVSLTLGYEHFFATTREVTTSTAARVDPLPAPTFIIGNGTYHNAIDSLALQLAFASE